MRGTAAACTSLIIIVISLAFGPYWSGKISGATGSLGAGVISMLALAPVAAVLLFIVARLVKGMTPADRQRRAELYGEAA